MVVFFVEPLFFTGSMCGPPPHLHPLCVDFLHTCTLCVWTSSRLAPSMCGPPPHMHPLCVDLLHTCTPMCGLTPHTHPLCVDFLHTRTLCVWTSSTHGLTPHVPSVCGPPPRRHHPCVDHLHTRPFFVCRSTTDAGKKFGRFGLQLSGILTKILINVCCIAQL